MPILVKNGRTYGGSSGGSSSGDNSVVLTQAQYDALSTAEQNNGTIYFITDGTANYPTADSMRYQEGVSVADALDELNEGLIAERVTDFTPNSSAWGQYTVTVFRISNLVAINFQLYGTPSRDLNIATNLPAPVVALAVSAGSPPSVLSLDTTGRFYVSSAGSTAFIGGCIVYATSD